MPQSRYRPPSSVPDPSSPIFKTWLLAQLREIAEDHQLIGASDAPTIITQERVDVPAGSTRRVSPTTLGMIAVLEAPSAENSGQTATLIIEKPSGELKVVASPHVGADGKVTQTLINDAAQATYSLPGVVTLTSNGVNSWKTQAQIPAETPPTGNAALLEDALGATYHLQTPHASLPAARVGVSTDGITLDYDTPGQVKWDFTPINDQRMLLNDEGVESEPREGTVHQALDWIGGSQTWVFDGVDDRIDFGAVLAKERTDAFSMSLWFKTTTTTGSVMMGKSLQTGSTRRGYTLNMNATNVGWQLANDANAGANVLDIRTTAAYNDGNLHHIVVTYAGTSLASGVVVYVDGAAVTTTTVTNNLLGTTLSAAIYTLGARDGAANAPFAGTLMHASMWSRVLTSAEVTEVYGGGVPPDLLSVSCASVLQHWAALDEDDVVGAAGISDRSTSNLDGTAEGSLAPTGAVGSLPVRGMSLWQLLNPGTIDLPLVSNGAGALPSYRQVPVAGSGLQYLPGGVLQVRVPPGGQRIPQWPQSPVLSQLPQRGQTGPTGPAGPAGMTMLPTQLLAMRNIPQPVAQRFSWSQTLVNGVESGPFNPTISTGQHLLLGTGGTAPSSGQIRSGNTAGIEIHDAAAGAGISLQAAGGIIINALADSGTGTVTIAGQNFSWQASTAVDISAGSGNVDIDAGGFVQLGGDDGTIVGGNAGGIGGLYLGDEASAPATLANHGVLHCPTGAESVHFRADSGGDFALGWAATDVTTSNSAATAATTNLTCTSYTVPANSMSVGTLYRLTGWFVFDHTAAATPTITAELLLAGSAIESVVLTPTSSAGLYSGKVEAVIACRTAGGAGTVKGDIMFVSSAGTTAENCLNSNRGTSTDAVDTTAANAIELRIRMTTAVASNTLTVVQGYTERLV